MFSKVGGRVLSGQGGKVLAQVNCPMINAIISIVSFINFNRGGAL